MRCNGESSHKHPLEALSELRRRRHEEYGLEAKQEADRRAVLEASGFPNAFPALMSDLKRHWHAELPSADTAFVWRLDSGFWLTENVEDFPFQEVLSVAPVFPGDLLILRLWLPQILERWAGEVFSMEHPLSDLLYPRLFESYLLTHALLSSEANRVRRFIQHVLLLRIAGERAIELHYRSLTHGLYYHLSCVASLMPLDGIWRVLSRAETPGSQTCLMQLASLVIYEEQENPFFFSDDPCLIGGGVPSLQGHICGGKLDFWRYGNVLGLAKLLSPAFLEQRLRHVSAMSKTAAVTDAASSLVARLAERSADVRRRVDTLADSLLSRPM